MNGGSQASLAEKLLKSQVFRRDSESPLVPCSLGARKRLEQIRPDSRQISELKSWEILRGILLDGRRTRHLISNYDFPRTLSPSESIGALSMHTLCVPRGGLHSETDGKSI